MTNEMNGESYKPIPEQDVEDETVRRPKSLKSGELDGADEKMLAEGEKGGRNSGILVTDFNSEKQNGDAKLNIGEPKSVFGGMDKEELLKYAKDPFWVRLRWFLFITFWLCWAAMLVGAIMIIYEAPKCEPPAPRTWWQQGPLAEILPDTKPEQLKLLDKGIKGIIVIRGEDVYIKPDESHEIIKLIRQAKTLEIKTIIDLDPTTSQAWFKDSEKDLNGIYGDYYIWKHPKESDGVRQPPNNWVRTDNNSSWIYSENRKQYYYAPFGKPFLNFSNGEVISEFTNIINYYVTESGVSGVRLRNVPHLLVDPGFEDEKNIANPPGFHHHQYGFYTHSKTENHPAIGKLLNIWKKTVKNSTVDGPFMVREELTKLDSYKVDNKLVVDLPLKTHTFEKSNIHVIVNNINHAFNIDNIDWPLWKVNSTTLPQDVLDIVTNLLKGTTLLAQNVSIDPDLLQTRESPAVMRGNCSVHSINNETVFAVVRVKSGNPGILVALNAADKKEVVNFPKEIPSLADLEEVTIQMYSSNYNETDFMGKGEKKSSAAVPISPNSAIVFSFVPPKKE